MQDLRPVFFGMAIATVAGLVLGGAFKPVLRESSDIDGPQILAGVSGVRTPPGYDQATDWTSQDGRLPDYVIGADWIARPDTPYAAEPVPEPEPDRVRPPREEPVRFPVVNYQEEPTPPPNYPSLGGDILAGLASAPTPAATQEVPATESPPAA